MILNNYTKEISYNLKLSYPIILGLLGHTLVGMIDNIMVGKLDPTNLAAVSLGNSFIFIAMSIGIGFSAAITAVGFGRWHNGLSLKRFRHGRFRL